MKFAAFALVASFCLVVVTAKSIEDRKAEHEGFFSKIVKCWKEEILTIKNVTQQRREEAEKCKVDAKDEATKELTDSLHDVDVFVDQMSEVYKTNCEGDEHTFVGCTKEIAAQVRLVSRKLAEIGRILINASGNVNACVWGAIKDLSPYYFKLPQQIRVCRRHSF